MRRGRSPPGDLRREATEGLPPAGKRDCKRNLKTCCFRYCRDTGVGGMLRLGDLRRPSDPRRAHDDAAGRRRRWHHEHTLQPGAKACTTDADCPTCQCCNSSVCGGTTWSLTVQVLDPGGPGRRFEFIARVEAGGIEPPQVLQDQGLAREGHLHARRHGGCRRLPGRAVLQPLPCPTAVPSPRDVSSPLSPDAAEKMREGQCG